MPLASVAPGPYVARVKVTSGSETIADLTRELDVLAGSPPARAFESTAAPQIRPAEILAGDFVRRARETLRVAATSGALRATRGFDLFASAQYREAAVELTEALKLEPSQAGIAFVLGWAHEAAGERRQAIGAWRAAAAIDPKMVPAHLALADAYLRMAEPALAAQAVRAGLTALPDSAELQAKLAEIQRR
jgi:tetratricopeptide (TPR) repeat protein